MNVNISAERNVSKCNAIYKLCTKVLTRLNANPKTAHAECFITGGHDGRTGPWLRGWRRPQDCSG